MQQKPYLGNNLMVGMVYLLTGFFTLTLLQPEVTASPLWLPAGIGLGILLFGNFNLLLGIFLADFFLMLYLRESQLIAFSSAIGSTVAIAFALLLLRRYHFSPSLTRLRDAIALILIGAVAAPLVNGSVYYLIKGSFTGFNPGIVEESVLMWLGDCTGVLIITPLICCVKTGQWRQTLFQQRSLEGLSCFGLLVSVSWLVFAAPISGELLANKDFITAQYLEYLPFPFLVWASLRFHLFGSIIGNFIVASFAIVGTLQGVGAFNLQNPNRQIAILLLQIFLILVTITALLLSSSAAERQQITKKLKQNLEEDHLLGEIASHIRQSLELETILETTVQEIQSLLKTDRTYVAYLKEDNQLQVLAEAVASGYPSLRGWQYPQDFLTDIEVVLNSQQTIVNNQLGIINFTPNIQNFVDIYQIKASLIVPLQINNKPLGILVTHQCSCSRQWQKSEINLVEKLATQVSIAIQQAQLYQQVQQLNSNLERQVKERTIQLAERMEELQHFYDMRTIFLQGLHHDLKTSMMGLSIILNNIKSPNQAEINLTPKQLKKMVESCDRSLALINAFSEEQLAQEVTIYLNKTSIELEIFINSLITQWQPLLDTYQGNLMAQIETQLPSIEADIVYLEQALNHLLNNALKHNSPRRNIILEAKQKGNEIECAMIDDGIGLTEQQQAQLFKLYVRSSHNKHLTGIGLGCYQVRQIVKAHGGRVGVESQPHQGTRIWFTLPINH